MKTRMLGTFALALALALSANPVQAQVTVGPMAGVSIYTFTGSDANIYGEDLGANFSKTSRVGFLVGGFAEFEFGTVFAIEPQLLWVQKGGKYDIDLTDGSGSGSLTFKLDYIQVPVLFKAEYRKAGQDFAPSLFAGPAVAFKTTIDAAAAVGPIVSGFQGINEAGSSGALNGALMTAVVEKPSSVFSAELSGLVTLTGTASFVPVGL